MFLSLMATALSVPGAKALQPTHPGVPGTFEIVGYSGVSAQQMFLGSPNKVYIVDKTENNELQVAGHAAWASEYDLEINEPRPMDILTNAFCAGGGVLANGTWLNVGGNQAVIAGGDDLLKPCGGIYGNCDGGQSIRLLHPCVEGEPCEWIDIPEGMPTRRWYPTVEQLEDGSLIIIGGMKYGGFINIEEQNNPTYEFYPSRGEPIYMDLLNVTLPANLYPLTWLLPTGDLFIQTNWATIVFNYKEGVEYGYPDIPKAVRTYPASGGSVMLPLTPDNEYTATIMFCGGSDLQPDQWVTSSDLASYPADASCVKMSPDVSNEWEVDDFLPEGRTMGSMILLPDQTVLMLNGANTGVAGYGNQTWTINDSYANFPTRVPVVYDPNAEPGSRWSSDGFDESLVDRLYHSSAILLPDGSVLVSGSNPHPDVVLTGAFQTEYAVERFYPWYYDKRRPEPQGLPETLSYGGDYFDVFLTLEDLDNDAANIKTTKAVLIRPGFSTHAINMSQRLVELRSSYTVGEDGSATLHVAQVEKPTLFPPGPGLLFITVNGVPSVAQWVMVGSGVVEEQPIFESLALPERFIPKSLGISDEDTPKKKKKSSAVGVGYGSGLVKLCSLALAVLLCA